MAKKPVKEATQEKTENDVLIEQMVAEAQKVPSKGAGEIIDKGDEKENRPPLVMSHISGNDRVYIYDTETGERSECLRYTLTTQLKKKRPDGKPYFTTIKPSIEPKRGGYLCLLHPKAENREHYTDLGLATCKKSNLTSIYQVERHMQKKHPAEWAAIKDEKARKEKEDDRAFQRELLGKAKEK